jgi:excinuclease UvrABC ATPase subunit
MDDIHRNALVVFIEVTGSGKSSLALSVRVDLGLGYLAMERRTPTLSPGKLQRLRLATQVVSSLVGVAYVLDEPSVGLHPADTEALLRALDTLRAAGNSVFVVEHDLKVAMRTGLWMSDRQQASAASKPSVAVPLPGLPM